MSILTISHKNLNVQKHPQHKTILTFLKSTAYV